MWFPERRAPFTWESSSSLSGGLDFRCDARLATVDGEKGQFIFPGMQFSKDYVG